MLHNSKLRNNLNTEILVLLTEIYCIMSLFGGNIIVQYIIMGYAMKNYKNNNHKINSITKNNSNNLNNCRNFTIKNKFFALLSIALILVVGLFCDNEERDNSITLQYNSIRDAEVPLGINLSQATKNNDEIFIVNKELIPGTYRVELTDTTDIGYVERYNSKEIATDNLIAKYIFKESGYLIIEGDDVVVKIQGVKITLQQNFYLFGF